MRALFLGCLLLPSLVFALDPLAPGTDDVSAIPRDDPAIAWTSGVGVGRAWPWGADGVQSDWIRAGWVRRSFALQIGFTRTAAGTVDVSGSSAGVAWRVQRVAARLTWRRRTTAVEGFAAEQIAWPRGAVRLELDGAALAAVLSRRPDDGARWRLRLSCRVARGPAMLWAARSDRSFDTRATWVFAGTLRLAPSLGFGLRADPRGTLWALDLQRDRWRVRVGRVVDGPRAGARAIALEWGT